MNTEWPWGFGQAAQYRLAIAAGPIMAGQAAVFIDKRPIAIVIRLVGRAVVTA
ncbi:hypothetical protein V5738_16125 [Salinisphaera sp. SPP-AMP-43]|uniref:hypothetical protein n=1 Tax=Salinisphaera sp. SPP-AMP-43 TaxID=3121288 RepID=UPI003C6E468A